MCTTLMLCVYYYMRLYLLLFRLSNVSLQSILLEIFTPPILEKNKV